jgi:DNA-binding ferritin-like protein
MDNLSLIYENSLHNRIRRDVVQEFIYQKTNNKHQKAEYMIEHVLNVSELEYLTEQGFLKKIGQGVKNIAKKAAPYAAAGLMAAGAARGETPMGEKLKYLDKIADRFSQVGKNASQVMGTMGTMRTNQPQEQDIRTPGLIYHIKNMNEMEEECRKALTIIRTQAQSNKFLQSLLDDHLSNDMYNNIKNIQDSRVIMKEIDKFLDGENELRREEGKPDLTVSVKRLNSIIESSMDTIQLNFDFSNPEKIAIKISQISEKTNALLQEMKNIKKIVQSSQ